MMSEFRDFAMRGNVVDMAVGIVIGRGNAVNGNSRLTPERLAKADKDITKMPASHRGAGILNSLIEAT